MNFTMMSGILVFWLISLPMSETVDDVFQLCQHGRLEDVENVVTPRNANYQRPDGTTLLMVAVQFNPNPEVVDYLIRNGAQVNSRTITGKTVLMIAAELNPRTEVIRRLLEAGASVNSSDLEGKTALMYAARHNQNPEVIYLLIRHGANVNIRDDRGKSAYEYALENEHLLGTEVLRNLKDFP